MSIIRTIICLKYSINHDTLFAQLNFKGIHKKSLIISVFKDDICLWFWKLYRMI